MTNRFIIFLISIGVLCSAYYPIIANESDTEKKVGIAVFDVNATPPVDTQLTYEQMEYSDDLSLRARGIVILGNDLPISIFFQVNGIIGIDSKSYDEEKKVLSDIISNLVQGRQ